MRAKFLRLPLKSHLIARSVAGGGLFSDATDGDFEMEGGQKRKPAGVSILRDFYLNSILKKESTEI